MKFQILLIVFIGWTDVIDCATRRLMEFLNFCDTETAGLEVPKDQAYEFIYELPITAETEDYECCLNVQSPSTTQRLFMYFRKIFLDTSLRDNGNGEISGNGVATTDWCSRLGCSAYLIFYEGWENKDTQLACTCKDFSTATFESSTNQMKVCLFIPAGMTIENDWAFFVTPFDFSSCSDNITNFKCANDRCIESVLVCDGVDNCGDQTDEINSGCRGQRSTIGKFNADYGGFALKWWWIPLVIILVMMTLYWCLWRPGWLCWRLGMLRDLVPFIKSIFLCLCTCTFVMNCGDATIGRHPYKEQLEDRTKRVKIMKAGKGLQAPGAWKKQKKEPAKVPIKTQPTSEVALIQQNEDGTPEDKIYKVKVEHNNLEKGEDELEMIDINEYPMEEWSGMHVREGR